MVFQVCLIYSAGCDSKINESAPPETLLVDGRALDVSYGPYERNKLDFWQAEGAGARPVAVYIHGGGFVSSSKNNLNETTRDQLLNLRISVAAINYRYIKTDAMPAPMFDAARAVQFLRSKAADWNIDAQRIAAWGGSAGACIALWLAFHDDLADAASADAAERESTRLYCIAPNAGQSSLDPQWMKRWFPGGNTHLHPNLPLAFGVNSHDELSQPEVRMLIEEMSPINHVSSDDPPAYMTYSQANDSLAADAAPSAGIHHPIFGIKLQETMQASGVECILVIQKQAVGIDPYGSMVKFLQTKLAKP